MQPSLFDTTPDLVDVLHQAAENGRVFYTVKEAAQLLNKSGYQIYWSVYLYRLDAFRVCGDWRIPWTSIAIYKDDFRDAKRQLLDYTAWIASRELPGSLKLKQNLPPKDLKINEDTTLDWYDINLLGLPLKAFQEDWADMLRITPERLKRETGWEPGSVIAYPLMYDYLVDAEFANMGIFAVTTDGHFLTPTIKEIDQMWIFDEGGEFNEQK